MSTPLVFCCVHNLETNATHLAFACILFSLLLCLPAALTAQVLLQVVRLASHGWGRRCCAAREEFFEAPRAQYALSQQSVRCRLISLSFFPEVVFVEIEGREHEEFPPGARDLSGNGAVFRSDCKRTKGRNQEYTNITS
jgi:hypothetical protein